MTSSVFFLFFFPLIAILGLVTQFTLERYLLRIGERRLEALCDPSPFRVRGRLWSDEADPASVTLPITLRLKINRRVLIGAGIVLLLLVLVTVVTGVLMAIDGKSAAIAFVISMMMLFIALIIVIFAYPMYIRYAPQLLELTEEGMKTRYLRYDRAIRWDEARLFAIYRAYQPIKTFTRIQMFELSSEDMVTRWRWPYGRFSTMSTQPSMSHEEMEEWITDLQGLVVARTGLPLIDLDRN